MRQNKNQAGFIPLVILIVIVLGAVVWLGYKHVNDAHNKTITNTLNTVQQNANIINR